MSRSPRLTSKERLQLQQLKLMEWAESRSILAEVNTEAAEKPDPSEVLPNVWQLTQGLDLSPWQEDARDIWFDSGRRGTIKVVTGAGKTIVAMSIAEKLQTEDKDLRVVIVVPTIVLMSQWYEEFKSHSNLPESMIQRVGGGYSGEFDTNCRILICVLASARRVLPSLVERTGVGEHLLMIADECHRAGAPEQSAVLQTKRAYSLGLSATPERDDDQEGVSSGGYNESLQGEALGAIVYEMTFSDATR